MTAPALVHLSPHPDDWIFFWGQLAASGAEAGTPSVFIHVTSGDAGRRDGWWEARERAALAAIGLDPALPPETTSIRGHAIAASHRGHRSTFFLRLPDGMPDGRGSPASAHASLSRLRDLGVPLRAIDGSSTYTSWADLVATIGEIMALAGPEALLCATEYRQDRNPGDHADHVATADIVRALPAPHRARRWYTTYCSYYLPVDAAVSFPAKARAWSAHRAILAEHLGPGARLAQLDGEWVAWALHEHARTVAAGQPEPPVPDSRPWLDWPRTAADDTPFRAAAPVVLPEPNGRRVRHPLTGAELAFDEAAAVLWSLLAGSPLSSADLAATLGEAFPDRPHEEHLATARDFMAMLLGQRLVVPAEATLPD